MKRKEKKIVYIGVILVGTLLFLFIFFSFYFSQGFLFPNGKVILDENDSYKETDKSEQFPEAPIEFLGAPRENNISIPTNTSRFRGGGSSGGRSSNGNSNEFASSNQNSQMENQKTRKIFLNSRNIRNSEQAQFEFRLEDEINYTSCDLYLDNNLEDSLFSPEKNISLFFIVSNISIGKHFLIVRCLAENSSILESTQQQITVFKSTNYGGKTTDLSLVEDLEHVVNFTLEDSQHGSIHFNQPVNLSRGFNFDDFVRIENNLISVNSQFAPELNVSATLTFYGLNIQNPIVLRDGEICTDCQILQSSEGLSFHVNHFSSYTIVGNAALRLFDSTDSSARLVSQQTFFYANYTNLTNSQSINASSAYCNITFPDGFAGNMTYNETSNLYEYNRTFSQAGTYLFFVSCFGQTLGFSNANSNDTYTISAISNSGVNGATVTQTWSQTAQSDSAENSSSTAGNITELNIKGFSTTQSWQGYVGNVSGTIRLADASGDALYNWTTAEPSGEIYATKNNLISWSNVQCFNFTANGNYGNEAGAGGTTNLNGTNLALLESEFGISGSDVDGVNETFDLIGAGTHDAFYTTGQAFSEGECPNTRVFDSSGTGASDNFEEVLLYEPVSASVIFTSLIEKGTVNGFDSLDRDFEMLVLENGHNGDVSTTPYYFFVELN